MTIKAPIGLHRPLFLKVAAEMQEMQREMRAVGEPIRYDFMIDDAPYVAA